MQLRTVNEAGAAPFHPARPGRRALLSKARTKAGHEKGSWLRRLPGIQKIDCAAQLFQLRTARFTRLDMSLPLGMRQVGGEQYVCQLPVDLGALVRIQFVHRLFHLNPPSPPVASHASRSDER